MELQAKQMQLHRDYAALHMGPPDAPMLYPGQPMRPPDMSSKMQQLAAGGSTGDVLRSGSAAASGASGFSRDSSYSCQFRYSHPAQQPLGHAMPGHGYTYGAPPPHMLGMAPPPQQQRLQNPHQSGSPQVSPAESVDHQQRQAQAMQQPGFAPGQRPPPYGDPLMLVGWQPRPPSYYSPAGPLAPFPGVSAPTPAAQACFLQDTVALLCMSPALDSELAYVCPESMCQLCCLTGQHTVASRLSAFWCCAQQAAPMAVDPQPSNEACMLGELKLLIDQLDQQTKATMKDSLYRISRHAQVPLLLH